MDRVQAPSSQTSLANRLTQSQRPISAGDLSASVGAAGDAAVAAAGRPK